MPSLRASCACVAVLCCLSEIIPSSALLATPILNVRVCNARKCCGDRSNAGLHTPGFRHVSPAVSAGVEGGAGGTEEQAQRKPTKDDFNSPEYLKGFLTNDRQDAGSLDNLTPNLKLAASATALVLAGVGLLLVLNPPPPKDQPLPTARVRLDKATPAVDSLR